MPTHDSHNDNDDDEEEDEEEEDAQVPNKRRKLNRRSQQEVRCLPIITDPTGLGIERRDASNDDGPDRGTLPPPDHDVPATSPERNTSTAHRTAHLLTHLTSVWPPDWRTHLAKDKLKWNGYNSLGLLVRLDRKLHQPGDGPERRMIRVLEWVREEGGGRISRSREAILGMKPAGPAATPSSSASLISSSTFPLTSDSSFHWPPGPSDHIPLRFSRLNPTFDWDFNRDGTTFTTPTTSLIPSAPPPCSWDSKFVLHVDHHTEEDHPDEPTRFTVSGWDLPPLVLLHPTSLPDERRRSITQQLASVLKSVQETPMHPEHTIFRMTSGKVRNVLNEYKGEVRNRLPIRVVLADTEDVVNHPLSVTNQSPNPAAASDRTYFSTLDQDGSWTSLEPRSTAETLPQAINRVLHGPQRMTGIRAEMDASSRSVENYLALNVHWRLAQKQHMNLFGHLSEVDSIGAGDGERDLESNTDSNPDLDLGRRMVISPAGSVEFAPPSALGNLITVCSGVVLVLAERLPNVSGAKTGVGKWEAGILATESSIVVPFYQRIILYHLTDTLVLESKWNHAELAKWWYPSLLGLDEKIKEQERTKAIIRSLRWVILTLPQGKTQCTHWIRQIVRQYLATCPRQDKRDIRMLSDRFERMVAQVEN